jgi:hypothetical protein
MNPPSIQVGLIQGMRFIPPDYITRPRPPWDINSISLEGKVPVRNPNLFRAPPILGHNYIELELEETSIAWIPDHVTRRLGNSLVLLSCINIIAYLFHHVLVLVHRVHLLVHLVLVLVHLVLNLVLIVLINIVFDLDMTLILIVYVFLIIMFMGYFDYMFSIARLSLYSSTCSYSAHPNDWGVSGRQCVSVVFILCLPTDGPYIPGQQVVDRGSDSPIESSVVHSRI